ncbi:hypothetical protein P3X46_011904 [Hevea brasiliensis]|uniref:Cytochrome P450 n=1 Tax=Hevea brasiliensis TaxID=3981 RepID=A0ABQ9M8J8_HEVBR|nr:xanthotoxin 5-hydroxylase CYP82C4 [Hevea brasiliensis]KAJ9176612.1 hypothetical protein P3X46_011904 [Hevea brasiliensis]KAJ9176613.1 hypothetical protein P3X46_011904 [Hevea brasiliensis]
MDVLAFLLAIACLLAFFLVHNSRRTELVTYNQNRKRKLAPEPCGAWPLLGHLLLILKDRVPLFRILGAMADKHGPVFTIQLGTKPALVVSSWEAVKDCFKTNDRVFMTRPSCIASKYLGYNGALFGLSPYGPYWRDIRKLAILELLSNTRLEKLKHVRVSEVETGVRNLYVLCTNGRTGSTVVDMDQWFSNMTMNLMIRMIAGKLLIKDEESERFCRATKNFMHLLGVVVISDLIPGTEWLDLQGHTRSMKRTAKDMDYFISRWVEEHLHRREDGQEKEEPDFIDVMLSSLANEDWICGHKSETVVKATAMNLIIAGMDTTSGAMTWALSLVLNHPEVLKQAQEEIDNHVGRERWVEESDFNNLPYLQAIVKETLRLYPSGPLSVPREAMEDCYVGGFYVPKGTRLLVNIWKLHRDPRIWRNPNEFHPERFLACEGHEFDVRGQNFEYIPFSSGRRACPGISSGMKISCLVLARILHGFNLRTPTNAPVDMSEGLGATIPKAAPLHVVLKPRLAHHLYQL